MCLLDAARGNITILAKGGNGRHMLDLKVMQCECQCLEITISLLDKSSDGMIGFVVGLILLVALAALWVRLWRDFGGLFGNWWTPCEETTPP